MEKQGRKLWTLREFGGQTLWDWLHLLSALAIPVVPAAAGEWQGADGDPLGERTSHAPERGGRRATAQRHRKGRRRGVTFLLVGSQSTGFHKHNRIRMHGLLIHNTLRNEGGGESS